MPELSGDEQAIELGIWEADVEQRPIDHTTARMAAAQLHTGQKSALYSLASCGAVDGEGLYGEIVRAYREPEVTEQVERWLACLGMYAIEHDGRGPVRGWSRLWREIA